MLSSKEALVERICIEVIITQLLKVIRTQLFTLPEETQVYSGHGNPTQIGF